jgi:hypothetical protein
MTVVLKQEFSGITSDLLQKVTDELNAKADPPAGLIVHTASQVGDKIQVIDVWDSRAAFESFEQERLGPAIGAVLQREGVQLQPPTTEFLEVFDLVHSSR